MSVDGSKGEGSASTEPPSKGAKYFMPIMEQSIFVERGPGFILAQATPHRVFCSLLDHEANIKAELSVAALLDGIRKTVTDLRSAGVGIRDRVMVRLPASPSSFYTYFALEWIGAIPVPLPEPGFQFKGSGFNQRIADAIDKAG